MEGTKVLGESWGGVVCSIPTKDFPDFYADRFSDFTKLGAKSAYRVLGIPGSYYESRPASLQAAMIKCAKSDVVAGKEVLMLEQFGHVQFCGLTGEFTNWNDPFKNGMLDLGSTGWKTRRIDPTGIELINLLGQTVLDEYIPAGRLYIPTFYTGKTTFNRFMIKLVCSNGAIKESSAEEKFTWTFDSTLAVQMFVSGVGEVMATLSLDMAATMDRLNGLKSVPVNANDIEGKLASLEEEGIPKTLTKKVAKHVSFLRESDGNIEIPENSPKRVDTMYDLFDALTFYVQDLPSVGSRTKAQKIIGTSMVVA